MRLSELMPAETKIYNIGSLNVSIMRIVKEQLTHTMKHLEDDIGNNEYIKKFKQDG